MRRTKWPFDHIHTYSFVHTFLNLQCIWYVQVFVDLWKSRHPSIYIQWQTDNNMHHHGTIKCELNLCALDIEFNLLHYNWTLALPFIYYPRIRSQDNWPVRYLDTQITGRESYNLTGYVMHVIIVNTLIDSKDKIIEYWLQLTKIYSNNKLFMNV